MMLLGVDASFMEGQILVRHQSINLWNGRLLNRPLFLFLAFVQKLKKGCLFFV